MLAYLRAQNEAWKGGMGFHGSCVGLLLVMSGPCWAFLGLCWAIWRMFMAYLSQLCSRKSTFEVLLRPALGPCWPSSGLKMKHENGVWGFMVHVLGSCWSCRDHVGPFWAYVGLGGCSWPILANFGSRKSMGFLCVMSGPFGSLWAYVGQLGRCSWPILANFVARKAPLRSCWGRPWGHVGLPQGSKWSMKRGMGFHCWAFLGLCWAIWRMFMAYLIKLHGSGPSTAYACKSFFDRFQVFPHKVTVTWAPSRDVLLA